MFNNDTLVCLCIGQCRWLVMELDWSAFLDVTDMQEKAPPPGGMRQAKLLMLHTHTHIRGSQPQFMAPHAFCVQMRHIERLLIYKETAHPALCPASIKSVWEGGRREREQASRLIWKKHTALSCLQSDKSIALSPLKQMEDITDIILLMLIKQQTAKRKINWLVDYRVTRLFSERAEKQILAERWNLNVPFVIWFLLSIRQYEGGRKKESVCALVGMKILVSIGMSFINTNTNDIPICRSSKVNWCCSNTEMYMKSNVHTHTNN